MLCTLLDRNAETTSSLSWLHLFFLLFLVVLHRLNVFAIIEHKMVVHIPVFFCSLNELHSVTNTSVKSVIIVIIVITAACSRYQQTRDDRNQLTVLDSITISTTACIAAVGI